MFSPRQVVGFILGGIVAIHAYRKRVDLNYKAESDMKLRQGALEFTKAKFSDQQALVVFNRSSELSQSDQLLLHRGLETPCLFTPDETPPSPLVDKEIEQQWRELVVQARDPSPSDNVKCGPSDLSIVYTNQYNKLKEQKLKRQIKRVGDDLLEVVEDLLIESGVTAVGVVAGVTAGITVGAADLLIRGPRGAAG